MCVRRNLFSSGANFVSTAFLSDGVAKQFKASKSLRVQKGPCLKAPVVQLFWLPEMLMARPNLPPLAGFFVVWSPVAQFRNSCPRLAGPGQCSVGFFTTVFLDQGCVRCKFPGPFFVMSLVICFRFLVICSAMRVSLLVIMVSPS